MPYEQWFRPFSRKRRCCQLPVSGKSMRRFLRFKLGCHELRITSGRLTGVSRHNKVVYAATVGQAMICVWCPSAQLWPLCALSVLRNVQGHYHHEVLLCSTGTRRGVPNCHALHRLFGQWIHDLPLLAQVISLVGWPKPASF